MFIFISTLLALVFCFIVLYCAKLSKEVNIDDYETILENYNSSNQLVDLDSSKFKLIKKHIDNIQSTLYSLKESYFQLFDESRNLLPEIRYLNRETHILKSELSLSGLIKQSSIVHKMEDELNLIINSSKNNNLNQYITLFFEFQLSLLNEPIKIVNSFDFSYWDKFIQSFNDEKIKIQINNQEKLLKLSESTNDTLSLIFHQLIRNSISHSKNCSNICINCKPLLDNNRIILTYTDNGNGLDLNYIKKKAIQIGLINNNVASMMSNNEIAELIFNEGFSTTEEDKIDLKSGRGLGMSIIKDKVENILHGDICINFNKDNKTEFIITFNLDKHIR